MSLRTGKRRAARHSGRGRERVDPLKAQLMAARESLVAAAFFIAMLGGTAIAFADEPAAVVVRGTVVSASGRAVEGAEVIGATPDLAAFPNTPPEKRPPQRRGAGTTRTDADG